jgi:hypothetical protein
VYSLFCQDGDGQGYVKFGHSTRIGDRLTAITVGCPIPVHMIGLIEFDERAKALAVEKSLLKHFKERRSNGEWFRFDFSNADDKLAFNDGCRKVLYVDHGSSEWWVKINAKLVKEYADAKRRAFLAKKTKAQIMRLEARRKKAVSERRYVESELSTGWESPTHS